MTFRHLKYSRSLRECNNDTFLSDTSSTDDNEIFNSDCDTDRHEDSSSNDDDEDTASQPATTSQNTEQILSNEDISSVL